MAWLMRLFPWRRRRLERDLLRELAYHVERRVEDLTRAGSSDAAARRTASLEFGSVVAVREEVHDASAWRWLENVGRDLRHACRMLGRSPGFAVIATLMLALPIAAGSVVFSIANTALWESRAGRIDALVSVFSRDRHQPDSYRNFSYPLYLDLRDRSGLFESVMAHTIALVGIQDGSDTTRRAFAEIVSSNYFSTLGVSLAAGRSFTPDEERPGANAAVAIASYAAWRQRGFDVDFLGSDIRVNGTPFTIVGVAPEGLRTTAVIAPDWWFPLGTYDRLINPWFREGAKGLADRGSHALFVAGALAPGLTRGVAAQRLDALSTQLAEEFPATDRDRAFAVTGLSRVDLSPEPRSDGPVLSGLGLLVAITALVLGVACLNLATLMLARGSARRREIGIRQAIGGSRARLVAQLLAEGLTLSMLGATVGVLLSWWAHRTLRAWWGSVVSLVALEGVDLALQPSWRMVVVAGGLAVFSAICFALGPAWRLTRPTAALDLRDETGSAPRFRTGAVLVALQLTVSLALLAVGGLFLRSAMEAAGASPGFALERVLVFSLDPSLGAYDETQTRTLYRAVLQRVRSMPGVQHTSLASKVAFGEFVEGAAVTATDRSAQEVMAGYTIVTSAHFDALRLPVLRGRGFTPDEDERALGPSSAVISEPLARRLFPDGDPLGRQLTLRPGGRDATETVTVVGVVPGTTQDILDLAPQSEIYVPFGARFRAPMVLHVGLRAQAHEATMVMAVRRTLREVDAQLPILTARTMTAQRDASVPRWAVRAAATAFGSLGIFALLVAAIGVYGLQAYDVARRTHEFAIRVALGATHRDIMGLVFRHALSTAAVGLALGLLLALGMGRLVSSLLYRVSPLDPQALTAGVLVLVVAILGACYVPARRATRIPPLDALKAE